MYIDYNVKIRILGIYLNYVKIKKRRKKCVIRKLIKLIDIYNNYYLEENAKKEYCVNNCKLDNDQKRAIYSDELKNLIIAGAGSGKTLTIIGKINYLIEKKNILPEEIICLSFTNEACNNLTSRLKYAVNVLTFHKFALSLIKTQYFLCSNNVLDYVIDEYFHSIVIEDKKIQKKIMKCLGKKDYNNYTYYLKGNEIRNLKHEIKSFICQLKSYGYSLTKLLSIKKYQYRHLIVIIADVLYLYLNELRSTNHIDLDHLITIATKEIKKQNLFYKYIIIDEFQDISKIRLGLVEEVIKKSGAKLMAVGDDYQSIYEFSGCNMNYLLKIYNSKYDTKVIYLKNNYRCSDEVVRVSTKFVCKNKKQIKKEIHSNKNITPSIIIVKESPNILEKVLNSISDVQEIMILGRNNNDIFSYLNSNLLYDKGNIILKNINVSIKYKTVHSAKGLEADCVILINLKNSLLGFPSQIKTNNLINEMFKKEKYEFASERRLFYVALTRTKKKIYLLYPDNPSIFLKEIIKDNKKSITYLDL